jgi:hypothetical protein
MRHDYVDWQVFQFITGLLKDGYRVFAFSFFGYRFTAFNQEDLG